MALSFCVRVEAIENYEEAMWRAHQLRQANSQVGDVAKQTPVQ